MEWIVHNTKMETVLSQDISVNNVVQYPDIIITLEKKYYIDKVLALTKRQEMTMMS